MDLRAKNTQWSKKSESTERLTHTDEADAGSCPQGFEALMDMQVRNWTSDADDRRGGSRLHLSSYSNHSLVECHRTTGDFGRPAVLKSLSSTSTSTQNV